MTATRQLVRPLPHVPRLPHETSYFHRRQVAVLRAVAFHRLDHSYPPTLQELARAIGCSSITPVDQALRALSRKGLVAWEPGKGRTTHIVYDPEEKSLVG